MNSLFGPAFIAARYSCALIAGGLFISEAAVAADQAAGQSRAAQCASCHGPEGLAVMPDAPNLAGQNERYLV